MAMIAQVLGPSAVRGKRARMPKHEERVLGASDGDIESFLISDEPYVPVSVGANSADDDNIPFLPLEGINCANAKVVRLILLQHLINHALNQLHLALVRSDNANR